MDDEYASSDNETYENCGSEFESLSEGLLNGIPPSKIKFTKEQTQYSKKVDDINKIINVSEVNVMKLKELALSEGGLVNDNLRKKAWPLLLNINPDKLIPKVIENNFEHHTEYQQVVLDVNRSLKRFPPGIPLEQRLALQNQLTLLILKVMHTHPHLRYYQGYHDVAVTLLLVVGEHASYYLLEKLSLNHLSECMETTLDKTSKLLNYIYPLIQHENKKLYYHLDKSGVGTIFALPWFLTWFGHSLNQYNDVVRLYDYFLASEPLAPIYLSAVIVLHRANEVLALPCDMANIHFLLSQIPDDLPFEKLLKKTTKLYKMYPPNIISKEVEERVRREQEERRKETALMKKRLNKNNSLLWRCIGNIYPIQRLPFWVLNGLPFQRWPRYRYLVATATFAVGLYAFYVRPVDI